MFQPWTLALKMAIERHVEDFLPQQFVSRTSRELQLREIEEMGKLTNNWLCHENQMD